MKFDGAVPFLIPMTRCIINCGNIKVEVFIYVYFWYKKIPLNESDDNYCRGGGHNPLFEDSPSECGGGAATVRYGLISK